MTGKGAEKDIKMARQWFEKGASVVEKKNASYTVTIQVSNDDVTSVRNFTEFSMKILGLIRMKRCGIVLLFTW